MALISPRVTLAMGADALVARGCVTTVGATGRPGDSDLLDLVLPLAGLLLSGVAVALRSGIGR